MELVHLLDNYSPVGDTITMIICVIILQVIHWVVYFSEDEKFRMLKISNACILGACLANVLFYWACISNVKYDFVIYGLRIIYHTGFMCCMLYYIKYLMAMLKVNGPFIKHVTYITHSLFGLLVVLDALSPLTGYGLHKSNGLWYDPLYSAYNLFYVVGMLTMFILLMVYANRMIKSIRYCLVITQLIDIAVIVYCGIKNINTYTGFTYVTPIIILMILLHSRPYNDKTGALSGDTFDSFVTQMAKKGKSVDYMVLHLEAVTSGHIPDELGKVLNSFWHSTFHNAQLFDIENNLYILAIPRIGKEPVNEEKIKRLVTEEFPRYYSRYQMQYKVIGLFDIDFAQNGEDVKSIINFLLMTMEENTSLYTDEKRKEELRTLREVKEALEDIEQKGDLDDERVLAYCQPIRNMKTGKFDTAEALMRMTLPGTPFVTPNIFIPLAEYYGHIHTLSKIILNKVCREIKALEEEGYQFNRISVNFAASEIRADDFCDEVLQIIRENGVEPSKIGIELTETQNENDFRIVKDKINILKNEGMTFYLDDIGTGYSNLDRIVKYEVDVVKFDRFFLLEAEKDQKVVHMMKHLSEAFKDLKYKLLYEGVENEDNETLCLNCSADYIQGFKYSKPLPIKEMRNFFEKAS